MESLKKNVQNKLLQRPKLFVTEIFFLRVAIRSTVLDISVFEVAVDRAFIHMVRFPAPVDRVAASGTGLAGPKRLSAARQ